MLKKKKKGEGVHRKKKEGSNIGSCPQVPVCQTHNMIMGLNLPRKQLVRSRDLFILLISGQMINLLPG